MDDSKKNKSWLYSDIYDRPSADKFPRTSIFQFGSLGDILSNGGRLITQTLISGFLFVMLLIFFADPALKKDDQYFLLTYQIVGLICTTISVFLSTRIFDGIDIAEMGLRLDRRTFIDFLFGFGVNFLVFGIEFFMLWVSGFLQIEHVVWETRSFTNIFWNIVAIFFIFIFVGWNEELLSRGFHLRIISKGLNRPLGIILSSAIFSYSHRNNPGVTFDYFVLVFLFGIIMSYAFLRTGQLWLAIGLHTGWDFFVTILGGESISGLRLFHLFDYKLKYRTEFYFLAEIIILVIIMILIHVYTSQHREKVLDW